MTDERLLIAIGRLDRALARVEAAAARAAAAPADDDGQENGGQPAEARRADTDLAALRLRHERLRAHAEDAVAALDRLIGRG
ncbi:hypothetical protein GVO57_06950 [Sphingomonas changnyeongensis]|uniref:Uncharacterized protein n=1 Tax=Sphingomonas changnyeongensis TaxID=2698679 RepID=A0A7Z2S9B8_9SPHN|nr:hypothetical protein GVO57_06950 [Sphingomonas changnyeongensis]